MHGVVSHLNLSLFSEKLQDYMESPSKCSVSWQLEAMT